jgi:pyruvate/2-oxoacid:ferredoxin oxidoreductase beta subunit
MDKHLRELEERQWRSITPGHSACGGCTAVLTLRHILEVMGKNTILILPASCTSVYVGGGTKTSIKIPCATAAFATGGSTAAGVRAGLLAQGADDTQVLVFSGDGGTYDIGIQSLSAAAERNDDFIYVCYDNEAYMNTGVQRSSATPYGCWTTTTPLDGGKQEMKKNILEIMAAHRIPYIATATVGFLDDLRAKVARARETKGMRFLHVLSPCATGWRIPSFQGIKMSRLAVETGLFPLLEIVHGLEWSLTYVPRILKPLREYITPQGRFRHLDSGTIAEMETQVRAEFHRLKARSVKPLRRYEHRWQPRMAEGARLLSAV